MRKEANITYLSSDFVVGAAALVEDDLRVVFILIALVGGEFALVPLIKD